MRSVLSPPLDLEFTSAEFPCDNPEIWRVRPPPETSALLECAPATAPQAGLASQVDGAPELSAAADLETVQDDATDVVIDEFSDEDFAHATLESVLPPAMTIAEAQPEAHLAAEAQLEAPVIPEAEPEVLPEAAPAIAPEPEGPPAIVAAVSDVAPDEAPPVDLFATYLQTLRDVALTAGARVELVEALPGLLGLARLDVRDLDDATVDALVAARLLARAETGGPVRHDGLVRTAQAWRAAIAGEEPDFSACGTEMLDEWSATVVAGLVGVPARKEPLRRELRSRGVAAFGLLIEAA